MSGAITRVADQAPADRREHTQTGRTPSECLRQWRRRTGNKLGWTKEQDEKLKEAIRMHGENWLIGASRSTVLRQSLS